MIIYLVLTDGCNNNCPFCIRKNIQKSTTQQISKENISHLFSILQQFEPSATLVLTGGEPTLHSSFPDILEEASTSFKKVCVTSNGNFKSNIRSLFEEKLKQNVYLQISIDGPQEIHDNIRGYKSFEKAIENIRLLDAVSNHLNISTTVSQLNKIHIPKLAMELKLFQFHHWKVSQEQVNDPLRSSFISAEDWNNFVDSLLSICTYRVHIKKLFDFKLWDKYLESNKENILPSINSNCGTGKNKIYITPDLEVFPCSCINISLGNLEDNSYEEIKKSLVNWKFDDLDPESICFRCKYKDICHGGCVGYSLKIFNKLNMGDIRCPLVIKYNNLHEKH